MYGFLLNAEIRGVGVWFLLKTREGELVYGFLLNAERREVGVWFLL